MEQMKLDERLAVLVPIMKELWALRTYLKQLSDESAPPGSPPWTSADMAPLDSHGGRPQHWHAIKWIDDAVCRIAPHLHSRRWPPVWWRLSGMNIRAVFHNFYRADTDGYFYAPDPEHPGFGKGYIPEREEIMAWVRRIDEMYQRVQSHRGGRPKTPTKSSR